MDEAAAAAAVHICVESALLSCCGCWAVTPSAVCYCCLGLTALQAERLANMTELQYRLAAAQEAQQLGEAKLQQQEEELQQAYADLATAKVALQAEQQQSVGLRQSVEGAEVGCVAVGRTDMVDRDVLLGPDGQWSTCLWDCC